MGIVESTFALLDEAKSRSDSILVAFSGGKDSSAVAELCRRTFGNTQFFFMWFVEGLDVVSELLSRWERQWGCKILQYPHWAVSRKLKNFVYCAPKWKIDPTQPSGLFCAPSDIYEFSLDEIYDLVIADTGIPIIATGAKKADSMWRRRMMGTWGNQERMIYPLKDWNKLDVLHFLKANRIPLPDSSGKNANGIDLSTPSVLWLWDNHREDYNKVASVFPFVEAIVWRRKFYGIGADFYGNEEVKQARRIARSK